MVRTPWGDAGANGSRGRRERLLAAMVASSADQGFEATSVADLLARSGLSRAVFYDEFENKADCFAAMLARAAGETLVTVERRAAAASPGAPRVEAALATFAELIAGQPAAARACLLEAFAAGPDARDAMEGAMKRLEAVVAAALAECEGRAALPPELERATIGGVYKMIQNRVARGQTGELAALTPWMVEWLMRQTPPPRPLRRPRRVAVISPFSPSFAQQDPVERILRGVAACVGERGYSGTTIAAIAARARVSQRTFYEHFDGKRAATIAALDSSGAQMLAAAMPAVRRAPDWPSAVHSAYTQMCGFMAAEPDFARLRAVEVYAAGTKAVEMRDRAGAELLTALVDAAPEEIAAKAEPLLLEAIAATVYALLYTCVREREPRELAHTVPAATYLALTPFIGPKRACATANGEAGE